MIGSSALNSSTGVEEYLERVPEVTGLEPEFDRIVEDPSMDAENPAATLHTDYGLGSRTDFLKNPYSFSKLDRDERFTATVHEVLEEKQFNGFLGDELQETHGISEEFRDFLNYAQTELPNSIREGMTQALTNKLVPGGERSGRKFYPRETDIFETVVEGMGFDLEEELSIEEESIVEQYTGEDYSRKIEEFAIEDSFYYETGEINGHSYDFMAVGGNAEIYGPEIAGDYVSKALEEEIYDGVDVEDYRSSMGQKLSY